MVFLINNWVAQISRWFKMNFETRLNVRKADFFSPNVKMTKRHIIVKAKMIIGNCHLKGHLNEIILARVFYISKTLCWWICGVVFTYSRFHKMLRLNSQGRLACPFKESHCYPNTIIHIILGPWKIPSNLTVSTGRAHKVKRMACIDRLCIPAKWCKTNNFSGELVC